MKLRITSIVCEGCGYRGAPESFRVVNEGWVCPECGMDESGLEVVRESPENLSRGEAEKIFGEVNDD